MRKMHGQTTLKLYRVLVENSEGERLFGSPSRRWDVVGLSHLPQNKGKRREVVKTVIGYGKFTDWVGKC